MLGTAIGFDDKDGKLTVLEDAFILPSGWKVYDLEADPLHLSPKEFAKPDLTKGQWLHTSRIFLINASNITVGVDFWKSKEGRFDMQRLRDSIASAIARAEG